VLPTLVLLGTGVGISFPSLMTLAVSGATPEGAGLAFGVDAGLVLLALAVSAALLHPERASADRARALAQHGQSQRARAECEAPA
jgi:hypothetical protein